MPATQLRQRDILNVLLKTRPNSVNMRAMLRDPENQCQVWNFTTNNWEAFATGNFNQYLLTLAECVPGTGLYSGTVPSAQLFDRTDADYRCQWDPELFEIDPTAAAGQEYAQAAHLATIEDHHVHCAIPIPCIVPQHDLSCQTIGQDAVALFKVEDANGQPVNLTTPAATFSVGTLGTGGIGNPEVGMYTVPVNTTGLAAGLVRVTLTGTVAPTNLTATSAIRICTADRSLLSGDDDMSCQEIGQEAAVVFSAVDPEGQPVAVTNPAATFQGGGALGAGGITQIAGKIVVPVNTAGMTAGVKSVTLTATLGGQNVTAVANYKVCTPAAGTVQIVGDDDMSCQVIGSEVAVVFTARNAQGVLATVASTGAIFTGGGAVGAGGITQPTPGKVIVPIDTTGMTAGVKTVQLTGVIDGVNAQGSATYRVCTATATGQRQLTGDDDMSCQRIGEEAAVVFQAFDRNGAPINVTSPNVVLTGGGAVSPAGVQQPAPGKIIIPINTAGMTVGLKTATLTANVDGTTMTSSASYRVCAADTDPLDYNPATGTYVPKAAGGARAPGTDGACLRAVCTDLADGGRLDTIFDNIKADTTNILNTGGAGPWTTAVVPTPPTPLSLQNVRDAMLLAPTTGLAIANNSVDQKLDENQDDLNTIIATGGAGPWTTGTGGTGTPTNQRRLVGDDDMSCQQVGTEAAVVFEAWDSAGNPVNVTAPTVVLTGGGAAGTIQQPAPGKIVVPITTTGMTPGLKAATLSATIQGVQLTSSASYRICAADTDPLDYNPATGTYQAKLPSGQRAAGTDGACLQSLCAKIPTIDAIKADTAQIITTGGPGPWTGGTPLTPQQVRDAMLLNSSSGQPAGPTSVDGKLNTIPGNTTTSVATRLEADHGAGAWTGIVTRSLTVIPGDAKPLNSIVDVFFRVVGTDGLPASLDNPTVNIQGPGGSLAPGGITQPVPGIVHVPINTQGMTTGVQTLTLSGSIAGQTTTSGGVFTLTPSVTALGELDYNPATAVRVPKLAGGAFGVGTVGECIVSLCARPITLTAQQVRDAMALPPTTGTAIAVGSVDRLLGDLPQATQDRLDAAHGTGPWTGLTAQQTVDAFKALPAATPTAIAGSPVDLWTKTRTDVGTLLQSIGTPTSAARARLQIGSTN